MKAKRVDACRSIFLEAIRGSSLGRSECPGDSNRLAISTEDFPSSKEWAGSILGRSFTVKLPEV
jgi:hypothetical protein